MTRIRFNIVYSVVPAIFLMGMVIVNLSQAADEAPRQVVATRAMVAPLIDGHLDEACWKSAGVLNDFSPFSLPDALHPETTIGRVCFDDDHLYISLECTVQEMDAFRARLEIADGKFKYNHGGVVEVFFDLNHDRKSFQQYMLHANGSTKITLPRGDVFLILNEDHLKAKASFSDTGYIVEAAFPLAMLHLHPDTGRTWGLNLNRVHDLYERQYDRNGFFSSWNSTRGKGFQSPELFGQLVMDTDLSPFCWRVDFAQEPEAGDSTVALQVQNETGSPFSGKLRLNIGSDSVHNHDLDLAGGAQRTLTFDHRVSALDAEAKWKVRITDDAGRVRYVGGTQKKDTTPGDDWAPPTPTPGEERAGILVFRRPYTKPVLYRAVPRRDELVSCLSVAACRGEFEPITAALYPLRNVKDLQVDISDLEGPEGGTIGASNIIARVVQWQSKWENPSEFEALEHLLPTFESIRLIQGRTQRLWLTLKVPDDAVPGTYRGSISIQADGAETRLPLTLTVLPFELARPEGMGYFMYLPGFNHPSFSNAQYFRRIVQDMRDHGMTTFTIYHWTQREHPDTGQSYVDVDEQVSESLGMTYSEMIRILGEEGMGVEAPLIDVFSMHYKPDQIVALDRIRQERNWPEILFYIEDEIDYPERIKRARKTLEGIRAISPDIRTTTALGPVGAAALGHMYDVWIGCSRPEMVELCLSKNKSPWNYSCRAVYEVGAAFERAFYGRFAWKLGLRGVGLWSYAEDKSFHDRLGRVHGYDRVKTFASELTQRYGHVYLEESGIVPSVTWEAVREGIDDYRYLLTLKRTAQTAQQSDSAEIRALAESGLELLDGIAQRTPMIDDDKKYGRTVEELGDMDRERVAVIDAIMNIRAVSAGRSGDPAEGQ